jgi:transcriptional regulator with XRE-family HTH domain/KaiC/GvpD/RAD55 family RecA-like ATPase
MSKISTGIRDLDNLIDSVHVGDNVVWEVEAGSSEDAFMSNFINQSLSEDRDVIYVSFNKSPQSILLYLNIREDTSRLTVLDCFTSGKGKSDRAFLKFYEMQHPDSPRVIKVKRPGDIVSFTETLNSLQDGLSEGARYIFDSLTGMQDLWGDENNTYKFFTYMCPRLYDLGTVAYWILEKEAHSQAFKANLRHITQVVLDLYKKKDKLFLKAIKLDGRSNREAFKPHAYEIEDCRVSLAPGRKELSFGIGSRIKQARIALGLSQKDLADKIGMTSSFVSQLENNQISPSLNSFVQIAGVLGVSPASLLQDEGKREDIPWLIPRETARKDLLKQEKGFSVYTLAADEAASLYLIFVQPLAGMEGHFLTIKKKEAIHVLRGEILVTVDGVRKSLMRGDTIYLKDSFPSAWKNTGDEEVELLAACF